MGIDRLIDGKTAKWFRAFERLLMIFTAISLFIGIILDFGHLYLSLFGGLATGFLLANALIVWGFLDKMENELKFANSPKKCFRCGKEKEVVCMCCKYDSYKNKRCPTCKQITKVAGTVNGATIRYCKSCGWRGRL